MKDIKFQGSLNQNKKCISIDGDGAASITFEADATQLAKVLTALADMKGKLIEISLKPLTGGKRGQELGETVR